MNFKLAFLFALIAVLGALSANAQIQQMMGSAGDLMSGTPVGGFMNNPLIGSMMGNSPSDTASDATNTGSDATNTGSDVSNIASGATNTGTSQIQNVEKNVDV